MFRLALEKILNQLISNSDISLNDLEGKKINLDITDINMGLTFLFTNSRIFVIDLKEQENIDVDISMDKNSFLSLLDEDSLESLLEREEVVINGNVKVAKNLAQILTMASLDIEEIIAQYTGDIFAHQGGRAVKFAKERLAKSNHPIETIIDEISTILVAPSRSHLFSNKDS